MRALGCIVVVSLTASAAAALGPRVDQLQLANGARLFVSEQRNLPMILVQILVDAGSRWDPEGREGTANLTADLLTEGTTTRSASEINAAIDFVGGSLDAAAGTDYAEISLRVLSKDVDVGLELMADVLAHPVFAADELERRREATLAALRDALDDPTEVALKAFRRALFGDGPYGHAAEGEEESVRRIGRDDVRSFYARHYGPGGALVVVVGDIAAAEARGRLEKAFAPWKGAAGAAFVYPASDAPPASSQRIDEPISQASIVLGHRGIARDNPDYEAISVMNYILGGGGFSSRLMDRIRTRTGLAYSVSSSFSARQWPGSFEIVMQTKNASAAEAIALARAEVERIRAEPAGEGDLDEAKRFLTGSFPLRLDSNTKIADFIALTAFYGLGFDYADRYIERVDAVTLEDVQRVAREYLQPERLIEVVVADLAQADLPEVEPR